MRVLVIGAHPDDEILGLGGTLARHVDDGDEVFAAIASEGASSRYADGAISQLQASCLASAKIIGMKDVRFLGLPDQRLDTLPRLEIVQRVEALLHELRPTTVYVHHWGDVNLDHRALSDACLTACRPVGPSYPRQVYCFETPSSTEWGRPSPDHVFSPTRFVSIEGTIQRKLDAMAEYATELRPAPHPRSLASLQTRAAYWGQIIGRTHAEPFMVVREVL
jgi:LmbE family N-acetylglucosaminyl deacetylase